VTEKIIDHFYLLQKQTMKEYKIGQTRHRVQITFEATLE
jgi:hypothetical protein